MGCKSLNYFQSNELIDEKQCTMFFALQVDRGNLSQAVSDNMLDQLHLSTNRKLPSS
jgi:hypothetical protein